VSGFAFLFRELLGTIRTRSALLFSLAALSVLLCTAMFALLLLVGTAVAVEPSEGLAADEIVASLSPRLSADAVDALYLQIRERPDVSAVSFRFAEELSPGSTGGQLFIRATSSDVAPAVLAAVESMEGITNVAGGEPEPPKPGFGLSPTLRLGLLIALVASLVLSLILGRAGYVALLRAFHGEIRILRVSGSAERTIALPVIALGVLLGLLAGLLLVVAVYLGSYALGASASVAAGLDRAGRTLGVTCAGFCLSVLIGALVGLLGASLLSSKEFSPIPRR
jgi:cell division protein FtsX